MQLDRKLKMNKNKKKIMEMIDFYPSFDDSKILEMLSRKGSVKNNSEYNILSINNRKKLFHDNHFIKFCEKNEKIIYQEAIDIAHISPRASFMMIRFFLDRVLRRIIPLSENYNKNEIKKRINWKCKEDSKLANEEFIQKLELRKEKEIEDIPRIIHKEFVDYRNLEALVKIFNEQVSSEEFKNFIKTHAPLFTLNDENKVLYIVKLVCNKAVHEYDNTILSFDEILYGIDFCMIILNSLDCYKRKNNKSKKIIGKKMKIW